MIAGLTQVFYEGIDYARYASDSVKKQIELNQAAEKYAPLTRVAVDASKEDVAAAKKAAEEYAVVRAGIEKKFSKKGSGGISVTDTDLASMRGQLQAAQQYHQQLLTLGSGATELNTAERESLKIGEQIKLATDSKTIARLKEKQAIADTLATQLRSNTGLEQAYKAHQQSIDANYKDAQAIEQRAREQVAANEVFGKGRTAIEQMTLATLEHQLAEAEGSDSFDPKYIASLRQKIAAQKDWVAALGQGDYKAVMQRTAELLRNAQELGKTYEDELALSGLTSLEREKIVARRAVELKYAKELANLEKQSLSDAQKASARKEIETARDIESAAAVGKATQDHMAKASDEINRSLTDALMRGFESGKGFAENLADTTKNLFNTMVLRPVISAIMTPVSGAINGVVQQGLGAVGLGGGSGGGGMPGGGFTDWTNLGSKAGGWFMESGMTAVTKGFETVGSSMMSLGNSIQGVDTWLKDIPGMSGGLGSALGYAGALYSLSQGKYGSAVGADRVTHGRSSLLFPPAAGTAIPAVPNNEINFQPHWSYWDAKERAAVVRGEVDLAPSLIAYGALGAMTYDFDSFQTTSLLSDDQGNMRVRPYP